MFWVVDHACLEFGRWRQLVCSEMVHTPPLFIPLPQVCDSLSTSEPGALEREDQRKKPPEEKEKSSANLEMSRLVIQREREKKNNNKTFIHF